MSEVALNVLARLQAVEYITSHLLSVMYRDKDLTPEQIEKLHGIMIAKAGAFAVSGVPAPLSDHYAAECEQAVRDILGQAASTLKAARLEQGE